MVKLKLMRILPGRAWLRLLAAAMLPCAVLSVRAQVGGIPPLPQYTNDEPALIDHFPEKPSVRPAFTIPVAPLGFSTPGSVYLFRRQSLISLDFLDENHLLFSFRATGLLRRESAEDADDKARRIRAVLLELPTGKIVSEATWVVPDRARYVWMSKDGHFLLRGADGLERGDATLKTVPFLRLPGRMLWLEMDPAQQVIVTNSLEAGSVAQSAAETSHPIKSPDAPAPGGQQPSVKETLVVRTLRPETGEVIRIMRVPWTGQDADWPVNSDGYLESVQDSKTQWALSLNSFSGASRILGHVDSDCSPQSAFVSEAELLVATCDRAGNGGLQALSAENGAELWEVKTAANDMWPLLVTAAAGSRFARETLVLKRAVARYKRLLGADDLRGQMVRVMDAANGKIKLEAPIRPVLDGGGNLAISPSGRRVAILNDGSIEIFELPPPSTRAK